MTEYEIATIQEKTRAITNDSLLKLLRELKGNPKPSQAMQEQYCTLVTTARFIVPVKFVNNADPKKVNIQFSHLTDNKGQRFLMAFTDMATLLQNATDDDKLQVMSFTYADFTKILGTASSQFAGFAINPFTENIIIGPKQAQAINMTITQMRVKKGELAVIGEVEDVPEDISFAVEKYLNNKGTVKKAYYMKMQKGETEYRLIIVDLLPDIDFKEFSEAFKADVLNNFDNPKHPFMLMSLEEEAAKMSTKETVPFYVKV